MSTDNKTRATPWEPFVVNTCWRGLHENHPQLNQKAVRRSHRESAVTLMAGNRFWRRCSWKQACKPETHEEERSREQIMTRGSLKVRKSHSCCDLHAFSRPRPSLFTMGCHRDDRLATAVTVWMEITVHGCDLGDLILSCQQVFVVDLLILHLIPRELKKNVLPWRQRPALSH